MLNIFKTLLFQLESYLLNAKAKSSVSRVTVILNVGELW